MTDTKTNEAVVADNKKISILQPCCAVPTDCGDPC